MTSREEDKPVMAANGSVEWGGRANQAVGHRHLDSLWNRGSGERGEMVQSWALLVFLKFFSIIKNDFFCIFIKHFLHQSYLKGPLPVKLT